MKNLIRKHDFQKEMLRIQELLKHLEENKYGTADSFALKNIIIKIFDTVDLDQDDQEIFLADKGNAGHFIKKIQVLFDLHKEFMKKIISLPEEEHLHRKYLKDIVLKTGKLHDLLLMRYWNEHREFAKKKD